MAYYRAGLQNVGSYQVGGTPYLTGGVIATSTEAAITFPNVTKNVLVTNTHATTGIRVHFNPSTTANVISGHHYFTLSNKGDNVTLNSKCKEIYISLVVPAGAAGSFELAADLTGIDAVEMFALTGAGLTD
tara:strand:- start:1278 stop:1670 length:393 start_codon:yes stop_codon:yes gene_type:complete